METDEEYKMEDSILGRTTTENDLGGTRSANMNVSKQFGTAISTGNQII